MYKNYFMPKKWLIQMAQCKQQKTSSWARDGFKESKWKFKMAFSMKGGGLECHIPILKNDFF